MLPFATLAQQPSGQQLSFASTNPAIVSPWTQTHQWIDIVHAPTNYVSSLLTGKTLKKVKKLFGPAGAYICGCKFGAVNTGATTRTISVRVMTTDASVVGTILGTRVLVDGTQLQVRRGATQNPDQPVTGAPPPVPHLREIIAKDPYGILISNNLPQAHRTPPNLKVFTDVGDALYFGFQREEYLDAYLSSLANIHELHFQVVQGTIPNVSSTPADHTSRQMLPDLDPMQPDMPPGWDGNTPGKHQAAWKHFTDYNARNLRIPPPAHTSNTISLPPPKTLPSHATTGSPPPSPPPSPALVPLSETITTGPPGVDSSWASRQLVNIPPPSYAPTSYFYNAYAQFRHSPSATSAHPFYPAQPTALLPATPIPSPSTRAICCPLLKQSNLSNSSAILVRSIPML
ncbi:hypothetical protein HK097_004928, partial [Rhizophlyctis rosea]